MWGSAWRLNIFELWKITSEFLKADVSESPNIMGEKEGEIIVRESLSHPQGNSFHSIVNINQKHDHPLGVCTSQNKIMPISCSLWTSKGFTVRPASCSSSCHTFTPVPEAVPTTTCWFSGFALLRCPPSSLHTPKDPLAHGLQRTPQERCLLENTPLTQKLRDGRGFLVQSRSASTSHPATPSAAQINQGDFVWNTSCSDFQRRS